MDKIIEGKLKRDKLGIIISIIFGIPLLVIVGVILAIYSYKIIAIFCVSSGVFVLCFMIFLYLKSNKELVNAYQLSKNKKCVKCDCETNNKLYLFSKKGDVVCSECFFGKTVTATKVEEKLSFTSSRDTEEFKVLAKRNAEVKTFKDVKNLVNDMYAASIYQKNNYLNKIGTLFGYNDEVKKIYLYKAGIFNTSIQHTLDYSDLYSIELIEDGIVKLKGGLGGALVGDLIAGPAGMITGSIIGKKQSSNCSMLKLMITTKSSNGNSYVLNFINGTTINKSSRVYNELIEQTKKICAKVQFIIDSCSQNTVNNQTNSIYVSANDIPELLVKYKKLFDEGVLTEDEYNKKKNELLNL